jgi:hypothetical protein
MRTWFARCNGDTAHNQPGTPLYIPGEPPNFPDRHFNYTRLCLEEGYARHGTPAAGDLREPGWRVQAHRAYGNLSSRSMSYLEHFVSIRVGDVIVIPAFREKYDVHVGVVIPPRRTEPPRPLSARGWSAYYYHYDIAAGDWYENAHRVDVTWKRTASGGFEILSLPELGGLWRCAFGPIENGHERLLMLAARAGVLPRNPIL